MLSKWKIRCICVTISVLEVMDMVKWQEEMAWRAKPSLERPMRIQQLLTGGVVLNTRKKEEWLIGY